MSMIDSRAASFTAPRGWNAPPKAAPDTAAATEPAPAEKFSWSKGAFTAGVASAGEAVADFTGLAVGGTAGFALGAAAAGMAVAGLGIAAAPVAAAVVMVGMGVGALLGAGGGASLADKVSDKMGQWGGQLMKRLGGSEKTGEAVGRGALALAVTAPIAITLSSGAVLTGAPIAAGFMLAVGAANKGVNWLIDRFRG